MGWDVTRTGRTVRIDVNARVNILEDATMAIRAATMEHLRDEDVDLVQLDASAFGQELPKGLDATVAELELLADSYDKELVVAPV